MLNLSGVLGEVLSKLKSPPRTSKATISSLDTTSARNCLVHLIMSSICRTRAAEFAKIYKHIMYNIAADLRCHCVDI